MQNTKILKEMAQAINSVNMGLRPTRKEVEVQYINGLEAPFKLC